MTVTVESPQTITATAGGVDTFSVGFSFESADEVQVFVAVGDGDYAVKTLNTHYTLTGSYLSGGASVVFQSGSIPAAGFVKIRRETAAEQPTTLGDLAAYRPSLITAMMDRFTRQLQEVKRDISAGGGGGGGGGEVTSLPWDNITGKPTTFTPADHTHPQSEVTGLTAALAGLQPLAAGLSALAVLAAAAGANALPYLTAANTFSTTTISSFARTLLDDADAATMRATLGVGAGTGDMVGANNLSEITVPATARATLGLTIGTHVQAYSANLAAWAGLSSAADKLGYFTGSGTAAVTTLSAFARTLLDDADAATMRATLGVGAGTGDMVGANNLSEITSAPAARASLGLAALAIKATINGADWSGTDLAVADGGTGASTASAARSNLGMGSIATQAASAVAITGGTITGLTSLTGTLPAELTIDFYDGTGGYTDSDGYSHTTGDQNYFRLYRTLPTGSITNALGHVYQTSRYTAFIASKMQSTDTSGDQKGALYLLNYAKGKGTGSMALLAQTFVENFQLHPTLGTYPGAWGSVIDVYHAPGVGNGSIKSLELGAYLQSAAYEISDLNDYTRFKGALWINAHGDSPQTYRLTYGIAFSGGSGGSGFFYGIHVRTCFNEFIRLEDPMTAIGSGGTVGIRFMNSPDWSDAIQLPSATRLSKWNGSSAFENLISWTTTTVTLGNATDALTVAASGTTFSSGVAMSLGLTVGTTLGVTGAATLSSTLAVSGNVTMSSALTVSGVTSLGSVSATSGTFTSTLGVSGLASLNAGAAITGHLSITGPTTYGISLSSPPSSCVGIQFDNDSDWSDHIRAGVVGRIARFDGVSSYLNVIRWDGSVPEVVIGSAFDAVKVDLTTLGLGVRQLKIGANGTGPGGVGHAAYFDH